MSSILFVGGIAGSGRRHVTRTFATRYGYHLYSIRNRMFRAYMKNAKGKIHEVLQEPKNDSEYMGLYKQIVDALPMLAKMHANVIMTDALHRLKPREYLFREARRYFDRVTFVWIVSDEEDIKKRVFSRLAENTEFIEIVLKRKHRQEKECEAPPSDTPVIQYKQSIDEVIEKVHSQVQ